MKKAVVVLLAMLITLSLSAAEAKKLGFRAWEVAKSMADGAVKGAKEAMKKDNK